MKIQPRTNTKRHEQKKSIKSEKVKGFDRLSSIKLFHSFILSFREFSRLFVAKSFIFR